MKIKKNEDTKKFWIEIPKLDSDFKDHKKYYLITLGNLTSSEREYSVFSDLKEYRLLNHILKPTSIKKKEEPIRIDNNQLSEIQWKFNRSQ